MSDLYLLELLIRSCTQGYAISHSHTCLEMFLWRRGLSKKKKKKGEVFGICLQFSQKAQKSHLFLSRCDVCFTNSGGQSPCKVYFCSHIFCFNQGIVTSVLLTWKQVEGEQVIARGEFFPVA